MAATNKHIRNITKNIKIKEFKNVSGAMKTEGMRESGNVYDQRDVNKGDYIDANGKCWPVGTNSDVMYPRGGRMECSKRPRMLLGPI